MTTTIKTRDADAPASSLGQVCCGICRRQTSKYTCPSCNLSYCSLGCFRSELHSQCSERFYRKEIEVSITSESSKTKEEKNKALEMLVRMEDEDGLSHRSDEENEEDSITRRFAAVDVSSSSTVDLLRLLTAQERNRFFAALRDPSSALAQELLESAQLAKIRQLPWWEAPADGDESADSLRIPYGEKPNLMLVPSNLTSQTSHGVSLLYNICVVLLAYAYVTRHLSISPLASVAHDPQDHHEARRTLSRSVPFLTDRDSTLRFMSLTDAVISFWSRFDPGSINNNTILLLLEDVAKILRPQKIAISECPSTQREESMAPEAHPSATLIMVMSDLSRLFSVCIDDSAAAPRRNHIVMKLTFYAAHILSTPSAYLHALADQVLLLLKTMDKEGG